MTLREFAFGFAGLVIGAHVLFAISLLAGWLERRNKRLWGKRLSRIPMDDNQCAAYGEAPGDIPHTPDSWPGKRRGG